MQNALALKKKTNNKNNWNKIKLWKSNSITIMFGFLAVSKHATIDRSINNSLNACKATAAAHLPKLWETIYEICVLYKYLAKTRSPCRFIHIVSAMPAALSLLLLLKQIKQIRKWTRPKKQNKEKIKKTCDIFVNLNELGEDLYWALIQERRLRNTRGSQKHVPQAM